MAIIVDGKKIAAEILDSLKSRVETIRKNHGRVSLAVVLVGSDRPSHTYVRKKEESARSIGIDFYKSFFKSDISKEELIKSIKEIQQTKVLSGLIIQLPLPGKLKLFTRGILNQIDQEIDVDFLTAKSFKQLEQGTNKLIPPTSGAILEILKYYKISLEGKNIVLIGRGELIGKPLAAILSHQPINLSVCDRETEDLAEFTKKADIIITGVGQAKILTGNMVKGGCVVIDAGVSYNGEKMSGDIDFESVSPKAHLITPVPGGVGPITVAKLLENVVINTENNLMDNRA
jgi:methylenetetrahydrofolate dehydrogenase (NADP+) / methenyltetrahydrofolate cyclohydrolase